MALKRGIAGHTLPDGLCRRLLRLGIVVSVLVIAGLPGTSGALAKARLETLTTSLPESFDWIEPGLVLGVVGTAALIARSLVR